MKLDASIGALTLKKLLTNWQNVTEDVELSLACQFLNELSVKFNVIADNGERWTEVTVDFPWRGLLKNCKIVIENIARSLPFVFPDCRLHTEKIGLSFRTRKLVPFRLVESDKTSVKTPTYPLHRYCHRSLMSLRTNNAERKLQK